MTLRERRRRAGTYRTALAAIVGAVFAFAGLGRASGGPATPRLGRTVWDSVYSAPQAARGESTYARSCARCHGATLTGANEAPPLAGSGFLGNWNGLALNEL